MSRRPTGWIPRVEAFQALLVCYGTQRATATAIGVSGGRISEILSGKSTRCSDDLSQRVADRLGVRRDDLFERDESIDISPQEYRGPYAGCWEWAGHKNRKGYGQVRRDGVAWLVHRLSFIASYGYEPPVVMHICDNPACFRPDHLQAGTPALNNRDMADKGRQWQQLKTHCIHGHPLSGDNVRIRRSRGRGRDCKTCSTEQSRARRALARAR